MTDEDAQEAIPPFAYAFYEVSVELTARSAVAAFMGYGSAVSEQAPEDDIVRHLQDALTHCAALSRYFFPSGSAGRVAKERSRHLRARFYVHEDSPLRNRQLRNALEHFDERIDNWIQSNPVGPIIVSPVIGNHEILDDGFGHVFKLVGVRENTFAIFGEKFDFASLSLEATRIALDLKDVTMLDR